MKKLNLKNLEVQSFTTENASTVKAGIGSRGSVCACQTNEVDYAGRPYC